MGFDRLVRGKTETSGKEESGVIVMVILFGLECFNKRMQYLTVY